MKNSRLNYHLILLSGVATLILYLCFTFFNEEGSIPFYMFIYFETFILFFFVLFLIKRTEVKSGFLSKTLKHILGKQSAGYNVELPAVIIIFGLLFRLSLFPSVPTTSPDVYRYVWEGKVILNGYNPFQYAPNSPELSHLHTDELPSKINFPEYTAIYPPFAQLTFLAAYLIGGDSLYGLKIIYLICEFFIFIFILKLLLLYKKNLNLVLLYAWLPLPIMEYFINTHLEPIGLLMLLLFVYNIEIGKYKSSALFLALAFLTKLYPAVLLPLAIKKIGIKRSMIFGLIFLFLVLIMSLPFFYGNIKGFNLLLTYLQHWEFNGSVYNIVKLLSNSFISRIICSILLTLSIFIIAYSYKNFFNAVFGVFICLAVFITTLYPWYLGWIAVLNPVGNFYSVMSLFFTSNLTNFTPLGSVWKEYWWVLIIEYVPFYILLLIDYKRMHKYPISDSQ